jgi:hypothetical protein
MKSYFTNGEARERQIINKDRIPEDGGDGN